MQRKWIVCISRYFDFWGFCMEFAVTKRYEECYLLILVLHIILMCATGWSILIFLKKPTDDTLGHANDIIKLGSILFVCILSLMESYFKRNRQKKFWHIFQKIENKCRPIQSLQLSSYLMKFGFVFVTSIMSTVYYYLKYMHFSYRSDSLAQITMCAFDLLTKIYLNRVLYYLLYLELIENEMNRINQFTKEITQKSRNKMQRRNNERNPQPLRQLLRIEHRLRAICEYYQLTCELSDELNSVFGWSNVLTILFSFALILTELNWVYWKWYNLFKIVNMIG